MFAKTFLSAVNRSGVICTRMMATEGKIQGKVKFFDVTKGFGFIAPNDGSGDCFVHQTAIVTDGFRSLAEGEDVEYDIVIDSNKGDKKSAANVTGPDGANVIGTPRRDAAPRSRRDDNDDRY